ncbi:hypothetical protein Gotur_007136 [Gossypium turneri]
MRRSQWSASCVMVCIGCGSVRESLLSKGTMEQTISPRSLVRAREKTVQSKLESKERQRLSLVSHRRGFHLRKR